MHVAAIGHMRLERKNDLREKKTERKYFDSIKNKSHSICCVAACAAHLWTSRNAFPFEWGELNENIEWQHNLNEIETHRNPILMTIWQFGQPTWLTTERARKMEALAEKARLWWSSRGFGNELQNCSNRCAFTMPTNERTNERAHSFNVLVYGCVICINWQISSHRFPFHLHINTIKCLLTCNVFRSDKWIRVCNTTSLICICIIWM